MIPKILLNIIIILVSVIFAANYVLQFVVPDYKSDPAIIGVFGAVAGAAFALSMRSNSRPTSKDDQTNGEGS